VGGGAVRIWRAVPEASDASLRAKQDTAVADAPGSSASARRHGGERWRRWGGRRVAALAASATEEASTADNSVAEVGVVPCGEPSNTGGNDGANGGRGVMAPTARAPTHRARTMMSASRAIAMMTADSARAGGPHCPRRCRRRRRRHRGAVVSHAHPRPLRVGTTPAQPPRQESCRRHPAAVRRMARPRPRFLDGGWRGGEGGVRQDAKSQKYVGERGGHAAI